MTKKTQVSAQTYKAIVAAYETGSFQDFDQSDINHVCKIQFEIYSDLIGQKFLNTIEFAFITAIAKSTTTFTATVVALLEAEVYRESDEWLDDMESFKKNCPDMLVVDYRTPFAKEDRLLAEIASRHGVFCI